MPSAPGDPFARLRHRQRRALDAYLRQHVAAHNDHWRQVLRQAGIGGRGHLTSLDQLSRLPPTALSDVDPGRLVLRPTPQSLTMAGAWKFRWAGLLGRLTATTARAVNERVIEPAYKPVLWMVEDGVPIGSTSEDLERLADAGRRWLQLAGVGRGDVVVSMLPAHHELARWELALGARRAGVAMVELDPAAPREEVTALEPTVLVATVSRLWELGLTSPPPGITTLLAVGEPMHELVREGLEHRFSGATVVAAWAPPGVRALWTECRPGHAVHLDVNREVVEVVDEGGRAVPRGSTGRVLWTPIGWAGTVVLRLDTGVQGVADERVCGACGRHTPRLWPVPADPTDEMAVRLHDHPGVADWYLERWVDDGGRLALRATVAARDGRRRTRLVAELDGTSGIDVVAAARREVAERRREVDGASIIDLVDVP